MTHPYLTRRHLEALVIGLAVLRPELAVSLPRRLDRDRLSVSAWELLDVIQEDPNRARMSIVVCAATKAQVTLAEHVNALSFTELAFWPVDTLIGLVNTLPERATQPAAWERDLACAREHAA